MMVNLRLVGLVAKYIAIPVNQAVSLVSYWRVVYISAGVCEASTRRSG